MLWHGRRKKGKYVQIKINLMRERGGAYCDFISLSLYILLKMRKAKEKKIEDVVEPH